MIIDDENKCPQSFQIRTQQIGEFKIITNRQPLRKMDSNMTPKKDNPTFRVADSNFQESNSDDEPEVSVGTKSNGDRYTFDADFHIHAFIIITVNV